MVDPTVVAPDTEMFIEEIKEMLTADEATVVKCILDDPRYLKPSGKVNINALAKQLGTTWNDVNNIVSQIGIKIGNQL